jgi:rhodanese-related sulfurtransferase
MRRAFFMMICLALWSTACSASAMTVAALQQEIAAGAKITVIDLRDTLEFAQGHIPGAISVPASLCPQKHLPPLGKVVVYDDGLGRRGAVSLQNAVAALAAKPGITVDTLQGGFAAWESAEGLTTRGRGLKPETFNYLTYAELRSAASDVVLLDLRKLTPAVLKVSPGLSDLAQEFPGKRVLSTTADAADGSSLLVLIDSGDGAAETAARALKAKGVRRYAILVGGELAIERKGKRGLERGSAGYSGTMRNQGAPSTEQAAP